MVRIGEADDLGGTCGVIDKDPRGRNRNFAGICRSEAVPAEDNAGGNDCSGDASIILFILGGQAADNQVTTSNRRSQRVTGRNGVVGRIATEVQRHQLDRLGYPGVRIGEGGRRRDHPETVARNDPGEVRRRHIHRGPSRAVVNLVERRKPRESHRAA